MGERSRERVIERVCVLPDADGTLLDSAAAERAAWLAWASLVGRDPEPYLVEGMTAAEKVRRHAPDLDPDDEAAKITALCLACGVEVRAYPWARMLWASPWPVCVVSSGARQLVTARLQAAGLSPSRAVAVIGAEDVAHGKPHREPFLAGAAALGVPPAACIAMENSAAGVISARAAGCGRVIGVTTTQSPRELRAAGADATYTEADMSQYIADLVKRGL